MTDEQIHDAIRQHAAASWVHALANTLATALALSAAISELARAEAELKARMS